MNTGEAKRYAHQLVADAIKDIERCDHRKMHGEDADKINTALAWIHESHRRYGPRSDDSAPRDPIYTGEPLNFNDPNRETVAPVDRGDA